MSEFLPWMRQGTVSILRSLLLSEIRNRKEEVYWEVFVIKKMSASSPSVLALSGDGGISFWMDEISCPLFVNHRGISDGPLDSLTVILTTLFC